MSVARQSPHAPIKPAVIGGVMRPVVCVAMIASAARDAPQASELPVGEPACRRSLDLSFDVLGGPVVAICGLCGGAGTSTLAYTLAADAIIAGSAPGVPARHDPSLGDANHRRPGDVTRRRQAQVGPVSVRLLDRDNGPPAALHPAALADGHHAP